MIKHYLVSTMRLLMKNKTIFFINLIGLSMGFACAFIILSYVIGQTSYDEFHEKKDRIYRVLNHSKSYKTTTANTPFLVGTKLRNNFPEVEAVAQIFTPYDVNIKFDTEFIKMPWTYCTSDDFFDVFTTNIIYGNTDNPLTDLYSIVITKSISDKYFNKENPIGKVVELLIDDDIYSLQVTAVIDDFPKESSLFFDILLSNDLVLNHLTKYNYYKSIKTVWGKSRFQTYFTLKETSSLDILTKNWAKLEQGESFPKEDKHFYFQALLDVHFNSKNLVNEPERGNVTYLYLFSVIGFLILFIVSVNYIILSMASSESRLKEIGLKKTIGCHTKSIRTQQLIESFIISFIGLIVALILINLSIDKINLLFGTQIEINLFNNWLQFSSFLAVLVLISIVSSGYISFFLARKSPIELLSGKPNSGKNKNMLQSSLTVVQIIIFTVLIAGAYSIYSQISFLKKKNPGFETENRLHVTDIDGVFTPNQLINLKSKLLESPEIKEVASGYCLPPTDWRTVSSIPVKGDPETSITLDQIRTSGNYLSLMDVKLIKGRYLDDRLATDSQSCVINLKAAKLLNFDNPLEELIKDYKVVGVVENFHSFSMLHENNPLYIILNNPSYSKHFVIKTTKNNEASARDFAINVWKEHYPDHRFEILTVKDKINSSFYKEDNLNKIVLFFCIISIMLASIGLYGQSLFSISKKRKEIGIRKVNGATSFKILQLYLKKYGALTLLANIISWPIVFYFINKWQSNFIYKEDLRIKIMIISFICSMLIVLLTVLKNTLKSSNTNPVKVLKYE